MRVLSWLTLALLCVQIALAPATAQPERDLTTCTEVHNRAAIDACTRLLKLSSRLADPYMVYVFRGVAHSNAGDQLRAIEDFTRALTFDPKNARKRNHGALYQRGDSQLKHGDAKAAIDDFTAALTMVPNYVDALLGRGDAYYQIGEHKLAIADYSRLIALNSRIAAYYDKRTVAHVTNGDYDKAVADLDAAIKLDPASARRRYEERADLFFKTGDCDRAIEDYSEVIKRDPQSAQAYNVRGWCQHLLQRHDRAIADASKAIALDGGQADHYHTRGAAYGALGHRMKAIADFNKALALDPRHFDSASSRGEIYEASGELTKAIEDYTKAISLPPQRNDQRSKQAQLAKRLAALQAARPSSLGRRVALIIGNAAYHSEGTLPNPAKDGRDVATALREADGFVQVIERYDLGLWQMREALVEFEALAKGADWAVVYYAGHGIEVHGRNYLVPVDAKLKHSADVEKETLPLDWVQARLKPAGKLQLLILDACRNNPFRNRWEDQGRVTGARGLARVDSTEALELIPFEQTGLNVLVAYATKEGEVALDGRPGENGPYARAMLRYLAEPGLEVGTLFRKVRDTVLLETSKRQQPYEYGSRSGENLFFRYAPR